MINRVVLVGRITKDPELKKTTSGKSVVSFTVACDKRQKNDQENNADFINCVAWDNGADFLANYVHKGDMLGIEGRLSTRRYESNGQTRYVTEVLCDSFGGVSIVSSKTPRENNGVSIEDGQVTTSVEETTEEVVGLPDDYEQVRDEDLPF